MVSNNVGYVDSVKVANSTEKGIEITKEINAKKRNWMLKLLLLMKHLNKIYLTKRIKLNAFANAKAQEYRQYQEQKSMNL